MLVEFAQEEATFKNEDERGNAEVLGGFAIGRQQRTSRHDPSECLKQLELDIYENSWTVQQVNGILVFTVVLVRPP